MSNRNNDIFKEDSELGSVGEMKTSRNQKEEPQVSSRLEKNKDKYKKSKKDKKKDLTPEELEELFQKRKKVKRNRRILVFSMLVMSCIGFVFSYKFLDKKIGETEETKEILYQRLGEAFVDDSYTEIISNISDKKVTEIETLYKKLNTEANKKEFKASYGTLMEQYKNQENAKKAIQNLYEGSNLYINQNATEDELNKASDLLNLKFNSDYQTELQKNLATLKVQFTKMNEAISALKTIYSKGTTVNGDLTQAQLDIIKSKLEANPNTGLKNKQLASYEVALSDWTTIQKQKAEDAEKLAKEQAEKEAKEQAEAIAKAQAEAARQAQIEAAAEQARQEALEKAQAEQAEREAKEQAEREAKAKAESEKSTSSTTTTPSSSTTEPTTSSSSENTNN